MKRNRSQAMVCRDGKLLLVEHRMKGRDFFNLPGGGIEENETPEEEMCIRDSLHTRAFDPLDLGNDTTLDSLGMHKSRSGKEDHLYNPKTIHLLQQATWQKDYKLFKEYSREIDNEDRFMNLRCV